MNLKSILVLAAGLFATVNAFAAPSLDDSWDEIRADRSVSYIAQGSYASAFGSDGFFNACVAGDALKSINPLKVCAEGRWVRNGGQESSGDEFICTREELRTVTLALTQTEQKCVKETNTGAENGGSECMKWENVTVRIPTTQVFSVFEAGRSLGQENGYESDKLLFVKPYAIPACMKAE